MTDIEKDLLTLIREAKEDGRSLHWITRKAGVTYYMVYKWVTGKTDSITVGTAEKLYVALTGKGIRE